MTYGIDILGKFRTDGSGASYIDAITQNGNLDQTYYYTSEAIGFATFFRHFTCPATNVAPETVATYPTVTLTRTGNTLAVRIAGGDRQVRVLVFLG